MITVHVSNCFTNSFTPLPRTDKIPKEVFDFSYDRLVYSDLIVTEFIDEEVGSNLVNGYAFLLPTVDVRDSRHLKAKLLNDNQVEITTVATRHSFLHHSGEWLGVLDKVKTTINARKLVNTLKSVVTRIKRTKATNLKKIVISFPDTDELSNEFFSPGAPDGVLTMVPLPYMFEHETTGKKSKRTTKFKSTESTMMWRVYIADSARPFEDEASEDDDVMDRHDW